jgi:deoxyribodipyrimidine photolyase-related protein
VTSYFATTLASLQRGRTARGRASVLVRPGQLTCETGPLSERDPASTIVILVESREWLSRRPYHRQRIATLLLAQRAFALEQAERGALVRWIESDGTMIDALDAALPERGAIAMRPDEREVRAELAPLLRDDRLRIVPNGLHLTTAEDLQLARAEGGWRMDRFYRTVRKRTGTLMERGKPVGGKFSFDAENRRPWSGSPPAPEPPRFAGTALRSEVEHLVARRYADHPGRLDIDAIPATAADVASLWAWAKAACLPHFGPFEDAMSVRSRGLFHTRLTPQLNLGRIAPRRLIEEVEAMELPLSSKEGFIRQVLGWREFVRQVHDATDGFRAGAGAAVAARPGDGGYARWSGRPWSAASPPPGVDGGATPNVLDARTPLPPAWWGRESGLACLDRVVADVWEEGWSHHITRLMVLANIATLLDVDPRELTDWFWVAYADAYDWVVEPNVLGMGTFAIGDLMTTKPYVAGSAYLDRMGDYCGLCRFRPGSTCPLTALYWDFLRRHERELADNRRLALPLASMRRRAAEATRERATFVHVRDVLVRGERLDPALVPR